jgi:hypothetical protein
MSYYIHTTLHERGTKSNNGKKPENIFRLFFVSHSCKALISMGFIPEKKAAKSSGSFNTSLTNGMIRTDRI